MKHKELSIIIPSYNEKNNLKVLLEKANKICKKYKSIEIVIVDNGSTDGSDMYLKKNKKFFSKIKIVRIDKNIGYGYGIKSGIKHSSGKIISWTHADLQFDINDVIKFFFKNKDEFNSSKIMLKGLRKNRSSIDIFFTNGMSMIVNTLFGTQIYDINAQPKMFKKIFVNKLLKFAPNDFSIDLFLLLLSFKNGFKIVEFPLKVKNRLKDEAKGGGTLKGKIKLTFSTLKYILLLKIKYNNNLWKL